MDMTLTAEVLDPGDDIWTMGDSYLVFSTEEAIYPRLFFQSFFPSLLGLNDMLHMVGDLNIATETQRASPPAQSLEEIAICGSEDAANLVESPAVCRVQLTSNDVNLKSLSHVSF